MRYVAMVALLAGCAAELVQAPATSFTGVGIVRYPLGGADFVARRRRASAAEKMRDACPGGAYRVDAEGPQATAAYGVVSGPVVTGAPIESWAVQFSCVKAPAPVATTGQPR